MKDKLKSALSVIAVYMPVFIIKLRYLFRFGRFPNLKTPVDLNEKILHLKLYSDTSEWTRLADKFLVRNYVEACGLKDILIPLFGVWNNIEDICWKDLPEHFILKANNGAGTGTNIIVEKSQLNNNNLSILKAKLWSWLQQKNIGVFSGEPQYRNIQPLIIAEKILTIESGNKSMIDYKIWCFNGKPYSILVCSDRNIHKVKLGCYDLDWGWHPENIRASRKFQQEEKPIPRPEMLGEMLDIARKLSQPFPQVRVDLYQSEGKVYFGELTFTSLGGMMNYYTHKYLKEMGNAIDLNYTPIR